MKFSIKKFINKIKIWDGTNEVDVLDANGSNGLATSVAQNIVTSTGNTTTTNIDAGATFTGTAEETFGINGIQTYHFADQDCKVSLQQSLDAANWDICDCFDCLANEACTRTFTSVAPYFRLVTVNAGSTATTEIRSAAGMTPIINPLPRSLTVDGRSKSESTLSGKENTDRHAWITPTSSLSTITPVRLVGTNFDGTTLDPNFWTPSIAGSGTVIQDGEIELNTGTTLNSTAKYCSARRGRFVVGSSMKFQGIAKSEAATVADNIRRFGAFDTEDGFFFELDSGTFSCVTRNDSVDTKVESGSFNGNYGPYLTIGEAYALVEIEWTPVSVFFYVNSRLVHTTTGGHLSRYLSLPVCFENINYNDSTTEVVFDMLAAAITRQGELLTSPISKYQSGQTAEVVCKYGAGVLKGIILGDITANSVVTLYDGLVAGGVAIWSSGPMENKAMPFEMNFHDLPFNDGLSFAITTQDSDLTVIYE